ncbi:MAG: NAD(P)H-hydrate dehydratase [Comamonadaceae bacterium]|nr:MAG: NAD(P)H-hydrate dehydratase [Comamonadaceae bacterium]
MTHPASSPRPLDAAALRHWPLPATHDIADKEDRGQVLVIAGSREIPGAALLAATAALRAGAGKLTIATGQSMAAHLALAVPEARVIALDESSDGTLQAAGVKALNDCAAACSAVLVGPGLTGGDACADFLSALLDMLQQVAPPGQLPVVLDALGMDALLDRRQTSTRQPLLLTPHAGEMAHLTGLRKEDIQANPAAVAADTARRFGATVALKGATTFIVTPEGQPWQHDGGNPGLATSGSGDVLAGVIAGLAARGAPLEQAAVWGVVIHALAGHRLSQRHGPVGFLARELLGEIPGVMRSL